MVIANDLSVNPPGDVTGGATTFILGDVFDGLARIPDHSVDVAITSPPFLNLRSYLPDDHPQKDKEIGRELTPASFLDSLLDVTDELGRVIAPHGSIVIELGDTYSGAGPGTAPRVGTRDGRGTYGAAGSGASRKKAKERAVAEAQEKGFGGFLAFDKNGGDGWPRAKSLCGVPTLYAWSLAYGRNLLNPAHGIEPWIVRNIVVWCKPSAPVQELRDKFRASTSYITIATRSPDRYFDLYAVMRNDDQPEDMPAMFEPPASMQSEGFTVGAPPKDYQVVSAKGFGGAHYATYPLELLELPIDAMCPLRVCTTCGEPSRRVIESIRLAKDGSAITKDYKDGMDRKNVDDVVGNRRVGLGPDPYKHTVRRHVGWTDCGHDTWRPGVVLDPFAGSGSTLAAATTRNYPRDAIGIDLDDRNVELTRERLGGFTSAFYTVIDATPEPIKEEEDLW